jgi:hypothetical protein
MMMNASVNRNPPTITEMIQVVIWTTNARMREQLLILRILDHYGPKSFVATLDEIAEATLTNRAVVIRAMKGLKELQWIDSERIYKNNGTNLPVVQSCKYIITISNEKEEAGPT